MASKAESGTGAQPVRHDVSGARHVILRYGSDGRLLRRFGYGHGMRPYILADKEVECAPHREFYTDADAQAVVELVNARVVTEPNTFRSFAEATLLPTFGARQ